MYQYTVYDSVYLLAYHGLSVYFCLCAFSLALAILGLTVLAVGNSVGDWVADTAVARAGKPAMGVASCFGSPLLNDVLGLGIALTVRGGSCTLHA